MSKIFFSICKKTFRSTAKLCVYGLLLLPLASPAESFKLHTAIEDTGLYFTAPLRWDLKDWSYFGGAVLAVGAAHHYDEEVRAHYAVGSRARLDGSDPNDRRDMLPAVAMIAGT